MSLQSGHSVHEAREECVDALVVGGGVVGLFCALYLADAAYETVLLEKNSRCGEETSTRNSGVMHAGLYYKPGSLKARLCVRGRALLEEWCRRLNVTHRICGKLVVASEQSEIYKLESIYSQASGCGAEKLRLLEAEEARHLEPHVKISAAMLSAGTGIVDQSELVQRVRGAAEERGALVLCDAEVIDAEECGGFWRIVTRGRGAVSARLVVNCAGLYSDRVAAMLGDTRHVIYPCRGEYCSIVPSRRALVGRLVYPVPHDSVSLGVHFTPTVGGELLAGPSARYIAERNDYENERLDAAEFHRAGVKLIPGLRLSDLRLSYSGIRPKRVPEGAPAADFLIERNPAYPNAINLVGIESPGLTASPAIAEAVLEMAHETLR